MNLETLARSLQSLDGEAAKTVQKAVEDLAALRAERDRYRAALQEIAIYDEATNSDLELCRRQWRGCVAIARLVLENER